MTIFSPFLFQVYFDYLKSLLVGHLAVDKVVDIYKVVDIPDESTDYLITDYDGIETLYYVLDGKIRVAQ